MLSSHIVDKSNWQNEKDSVDPRDVACSLKCDGCPLSPPPDFTFATRLLATMSPRPAGFLYWAATLYGESKHTRARTIHEKSVTIFDRLTDDAHSITDEQFEEAGGIVLPRWCIERILLLPCVLKEESAFALKLVRFGGVKDCDRGLSTRLRRWTMS